MKIYLLITSYLATQNAFNPVCSKENTASHTNIIETDNHCIFESTCILNDQVCSSACFTASAEVVQTPVLYSVKEIIPPAPTDSFEADTPAGSESTAKQTIETNSPETEAVEVIDQNITIETTEELDSTVEPPVKITENTTTIIDETANSNTEEFLESDNSTVSEEPIVNEEYLEVIKGNSSDLPNTIDESDSGDLVLLNNTEKSDEKKENITIKIPKKKAGFNYASFDCGALILGSNKEAKYPKAVLLNSKDEYMLSPCDAQKYVEIELCQNILVNSISLANFEYFSSMFKDFKLYGSSKLPEWKLLGTFQAKNVRDRQVFNLDDPVLWTKYIRIEFDSYYGSEYYCPITSVQVYGTSMMEQAQDLEQELDKLNTTEIIIPEVKSIARPELPFNDVCINEEKPKEKQNNIFSKIIKRLNQLEQTTSNLDLYFLELSYNVKRNSKSLSENRFQEQLSRFEKQMNEKLNEKNREIEEKMDKIQALMESLNKEVHYINLVEVDPILEQNPLFHLPITREPVVEIVNKAEVREKVEYVIKEVTEKKVDDEEKKKKKKKQKLI
ncbi:hypothetical protein HK103_005654 [Boothiomyces macroporosus]|uniref:SUN domain-containing protein n=1 Tax=Boothiomyces macroporosus TaxID=261099 RepID=A0AAD5UJ60_9FUNG|nr:hypothetical protein HK103_005654 [Boothiomyces macroporosus]